jgi:hypothetical protein
MVCVLSRAIAIAALFAHRLIDSQTTVHHIRVHVALFSEVLMPARAATFLLLSCSLVAATTFAQHGSAESGYFPATYAGDTFSGKVTAVDDASRTVTLEFSAPNKKTETFTGTIEKDYVARWKDGTNHTLQPSDIPIGTQLKVYYMPREVKVDGKKMKVSTIIQIREAPNLNKQYSYFRVGTPAS